MADRTILSPNCSSRPNGVRDIYGVVLHHTASAGGSGLAVAKMFAKSSSQVSAHKVVDKDASTYTCVPIAKAAWHAGKCRRYDWDRDGKLEDWESSVNTHTLGIEIVNKGDGKDPFPDKQIKKVASIIRAWDRQCPNLKLRDITDHEAVSLSGKVDLQANFPAALFFWYILHPRKAPPSNILAHLPGWAQARVREIKK